MFVYNFFSKANCSDQCKIEIVTSGSKFLLFTKQAQKFLLLLSVDYFRMGVRLMIHISYDKLNFEYIIKKLW